MVKYLPEKTVLSAAERKKIIVHFWINKSKQG
jgi:hypothetical protein